MRKLKSFQGPLQRLCPPAGPSPGCDRQRQFCEIFCIEVRKEKAYRDAPLAAFSSGEEGVTSDMDGKKILKQDFSVTPGLTLFSLKKSGVAVSGNEFVTFF
jgi:hypothetical protein